jgi:hypothetical protein
MTVQCETSMEFKKYHVLETVELLELIGRVADCKYKETNGIPLENKIEFVLDILFEVVNFERKELQVEVDEESSSDSDY